MKGASVAEVVSTFGVGGIAGIWMRAEHERTERFRERNDHGGRGVPHCYVRASVLRSLLRQTIAMSGRFIV
jgi:hypothetical protein